MIACLLTARTTCRGLILAVALSFAPNTRAAECFDLIPEAARPEGEMWLCLSAHNGRLERYSCQDYVDARVRYRLFFRGGVVPKAVAVFRHGKPRKFQLIERNTTAPQQTCEIATPAGVPEDALHLGTGVCRNDCGKRVPCSVFRLEAARYPAIVHYTVLYDSQGYGPMSLDTRKLGTNDEAMMAELSFQLGTNLLDANCCMDQALDYLGYAYRLFPDDTQYRESYFHLQERFNTSGEK